MGVARHAVPDTARLQRCHSHGKLACFQHIRMNELVDDSLIGSIGITQRALCGILQGDQLCLVGRVGRRTHHVKFCRSLLTVTGKDHFLCAFCDVQAVFIAKAVLHSVRCDGSGTSDIADSDLAALKEIVGTEIFPAVDPLFNGDMFFHRHTSQCHHAVHVGVYGYHLIRMVEILNQELVPKFFGCVAFYISLICGITNIHMFLPLIYIQDGFYAIPVDFFISVEKTPTSFRW